MCSCVLALVLQVIGLLVGFVTDRFLYAFVVFGAGVALTILVRAQTQAVTSIKHRSLTRLLVSLFLYQLIGPNWPYLNKHPLKWRPNNTAPNDKAQ